MRKVIQMPRRTKTENEDRKMHRSMTSIFEESESLSKMQRWLELSNSPLEDGSEPDEKRPAA